MPRSLPDGVYEHLVTLELERALATLEPHRQQVLEELGDVEAHLALARHLGREVERTLQGLPSQARDGAAREVVDRLIDLLAALAAERGLETEPILQQRVTPPPRQLLAIHRGAVPLRPTSSLASSTLLTRNRAEPALGNELAREIATADRIDAIVAFVTVGGVRAIRDALDDFARRGTGERMRLLTTTFTGTTEAEALDALAQLPGVAVRVSYDVRRTRLHAKAWLFHRDSGLSTAYIGSANLTATALGGGQEWMVKICAADLPQVVEKFEGTFATLWADPEFEAYDPASDDQRQRLRAALGSERRSAGDVTTLITLRPYPFQEEILDRLAAERAIHGRHRNLVVAATGTGKTVIAAFDYARIAAAAGVRPRLLFLAHRREILTQARDTFRHALQDGAFGELLAGGDEPELFEHVFATIQSTASGTLDRLGPDHWRHVIIDECHHVPAASYQAVVTRLTPDVLVGLTATPERSDGRSLLPDFGGHIAAELRLWSALDAQLLVPFEYFGLTDTVDLRQVRWTRTGYDLAALAGVYTGNEARASLILGQLQRRVVDLRGLRALGFCVSVDHAEFMADRFAAAGVPALALHGDSPDELRRDAPRRLRDREVNVLFTCDLYNEGVDLPFVDTLLLLRPTQSATLFLQQLGRGLRHHDRKTSCLVLDFIGQHHEQFRFDAVLAALTGVPRAHLRRAVTDGFPFLPSGCTLQLDAVARNQILDSLRSTLRGAKRLAAELRETAAVLGEQVSLSRFLEETVREPEDVYDAGGWTTLRRRAGLETGTDEETEDLSRRLGWLLHVDEPPRLRAYRSAVLATQQGRAPALAPRDRTRIQMLELQLNHRGVIRTAEETVHELATRPGIASELVELCEVLEDRVGLASDSYPVPEWPLALHRHYQRREIVAAVGFVRAGEKGKTPQGGILKLDGGRELLFVTLDKSGKGFSPSTRYRDYAVSRECFHWETQGAASVDRASGRRYVESPGNGCTFHLFVRTDPSAAYAFLGPLEYQSHSGDRPIAITWRLVQAMPAALFERYATLRPG